MKIKESNRRDFLKQSAFLGTLLSFDPLSLLAGEKTGQILQMSSLRERYVPVSIVWDTANLIIKDKNVPWKIKDTISEEFNLMVSGAVLEKRPEFISEIIEIAKKGGSWDDENHPNVALVAGWLIYREIKKVYTPLYRAESSNATLRRDLEVLNYKIRKATSPITASEMESLLGQLFHRATFRTHTLKPDKDNWNKWVVAYMDWYKQDRANMKALGEAWVKGVGTEPSSHFNPDDELIQLANDYAVREITLSREFLQNKGSSSYAEALSKATWAVKLLEDYFEDRISKATFRQELQLDEL